MGWWHVSGCRFLWGIKWWCHPGCMTTASVCYWKSLMTIPDLVETIGLYWIWYSVLIGIKTQAHLPGKNHMTLFTTPTGAIMIFWDFLETIYLVIFSDFRLENLFIPNFLSLYASFLDPLSLSWPIIFHLTLPFISIHVFQALLCCNINHVQIMSEQDAQSMHHMSFKCCCVTATLKRSRPGHCNNKENHAPLVKDSRRRMKSTQTSSNLRLLLVHQLLPYVLLIMGLMELWGWWSSSCSCSSSHGSSYDCS